MRLAVITELKAKSSYIVGLDPGLSRSGIERLIATIAASQQKPSS